MPYQKKESKKPETILADSIKDLYVLKKTHERLKNHDSKKSLENSMTDLKADLVEKINKI